MADPEYAWCFVVPCLILWIPNVIFTCFAYADVTKKYSYLKICEDVPLA